MSTVPGELRLGESTARRVPTLPTGAWFYFAAVVVVTITGGTVLVPRIGSGTSGWTAFIVLSTCAAIAQLFVVRTTRDQSYHTSTAFLIAGALLLPPELVLLMGLVQHVPEWLKHRYAWYIQTFNIANYTLDGLAAWGVARLVFGHAPGWANGGQRAAIAGLTACVVFVGLNHALMAGMLYLARGHRPGETGLFSPAMLSTDLVLASLGIGIAAFWHVNPTLIPFALAPLLLIHRSLHVPRLQEQARIDPKTGLFNSRHFAAVLTNELGRAQRFARPVSLIMADLDLLREINNTYGHLVGDEVLAGIADIFREELRDYDVPARFGGEEFAMLLPETDQEQALEIAERIRRAVAGRVFDFANASEPVRVTISMGVASFPMDGKDPTELRSPRRPRRLPGEAPGPEPRARHRLRGTARTLGPCAAPRRAAAGGTARGRQPPPAVFRDRRSPPHGAAGRQRAEVLRSVRRPAVVVRHRRRDGGHPRRRRRCRVRPVDGRARDAGKLAIPDSILMKPATLDTAEWGQMRRHADEGARIIDRLGFLADAVPSIRHHHERFDGSGYPEGLCGEEIPLGARIIHVADALDSMLTSRIYRPALSEDDALAELKNGAGKQFCPRCVKALEQILGVETEERQLLLATS